MVWVYKPPTLYDYRMTMVSALIATDGITCIGDGRVKKENGDVETDEEVKLFELSPHVVALPDGGVIAGLPEIMAILKRTFEKLEGDNVTEIAQFVADFFKDGHRDSPHEEAYGIIIAGYDDKMQPKLYRVESGDWRVATPIAPYDVGGYTDVARKIYEEEFNQKSRLMKMNRLALKALKETMVTYPDDVAGKVSLWNITPGKKGVKKYDLKGITILQKDL